MKTFKHLLTLALVTIFAVSCKNETTPEIITVSNIEETITEEVANIDPNATYAKAQFKIEGMTCAMGCAKTIEKKIAKMDGVKFATVDFDKQLAMVEYNEAKVTPESLENTVTGVADSYKVKDMQTVKVFSNDKKECTMKCKADCTKENCLDCSAKTAECKKKCAQKTETEKMTCAKDCKKACCTETKKV